MLGWRFGLLIGFMVFVNLVHMNLDVLSIYLFCAYLLWTEFLYFVFRIRILSFEGSSVLNLSLSSIILTASVGIALMILGIRHCGIHFLVALFSVVLKCLSSTLPSSVLTLLHKIDSVYATLRIQPSQLS